MTELQSNRLSDMAERIRGAELAMNSASREMAERALESGHLLVEAKEECRHGEWLPFLERAGMHERQARRLMQLARSGLKPDTVSDLGVKGALALLTNWKLPLEGNVLVVSAKHEAAEKFGGNAFVWESHDHPGYYHVAGVAREFAFSEATQRPISGVSRDTVFKSVEQILGDWHGEMTFAVVSIPRALCEAFRHAVHGTEDAEGFANQALALIHEADRKLAS